MQRSILQMHSTRLGPGDGRADGDYSANSNDSQMTETFPLGSDSEGGSAAFTGRTSDTDGECQSLLCEFRALATAPLSGGPLHDRMPGKLDQEMARLSDRKKGFPSYHSSVE